MMWACILHTNLCSQTHSQMKNNLCLFQSKFQVMTIHLPDCDCMCFPGWHHVASNYQGFCVLLCKVTINIITPITNITRIIVIIIVITITVSIIPLCTKNMSTGNFTCVIVCVCVYVFFTVARERSFPKLTSHAGTWHAHKHTLKDSKKYLCLKLWRWQRQWRVISLQVGSDILLSFSLFSIQYPCKLSMCTQDSACKIALASLRHWCQSQHVKSDIRLEMDVVRMDRACVRPVW